MSYIIRKLLITIAVSLFSGAYSAWSQIEVEAAPSETVELMIVMAALPEGSPFNMPRVLPEYKTFVDSWFAKYRDHSAIKFIVRKIMKKGRIDLATPADIGVNSEIVDGKFVYTGNGKGWDDKTRDRFVEEVNKFYRDTDFHSFWERVRDNLYPSVVPAFNNNIIPKLNLGWLSGFIPVEGPLNYRITISLLCGDYNFGCTKNGVPNPVIGLSGGGIGRIMNPVPETFGMYIPLTIHEYLHPFCNPLIDKYYPELEAAGDVIFPKTRELTTKLHYNNWRIVLYESLDRIHAFGRHVRTIHKEQYREG